jgi:hypothetical protein
MLHSFVAAPAMGLHSAIVMPYLTHYGTKEQQEKYLPAMTAGECIARCVIPKARRCDSITSETINHSLTHLTPTD